VTEGAEEVVKKGKIGRGVGRGGERRE